MAPPSNYNQPGAFRELSRRVVSELLEELAEENYATDYVRALQYSYVDDLARIGTLGRRGALLEVGGFPFCFSLCLRRMGIEPTTVDLAPQRAQAFIDRHSLKVLGCDVEKDLLPFKDGTFSTAILCATFEHFRIDPIHVLEEIRRVLTPEGLLYLTTPNFYRLGNVVSFILGRGLAFDPIREYGKLRAVGHMGHVREYTASEMSRFLGGSGYSGIHIERRATPSKRGVVVDGLHYLIPGIRGELVITARCQDS